MAAPYQKKNKFYKKPSTSFFNNIFNNKYFINFLTIFYMKYEKKNNAIKAYKFLLKPKNRLEYLQKYIQYQAGEIITDQIIDFSLLENNNINNFLETV